MARALRIEYAGAVYHVMARGNQGQDIVGDDRDRRSFLETLGEACQKTGWKAHAYLERAMRCLGLGREGLRQLPKGAPEKIALAWWLREGTTVSLRWVSERLEMGHYTRVSQAISWMKRGAGRQQERLRCKLRRLELKKN